MIRSFTDKKTEAVFNGISPKGFPADLISLGFIEVPPMQPLPPLHPGEVLREEFMEPLGLTAYALAKACRVPRTRIERIAREEIGITADTVRLGRYLKTTPQFWLNLQADYDMRVAQAQIGATLEMIEPRRLEEA